MLHHQAFVLHDSDPGFGQFFGRVIISNAKLKPYGTRLLGNDVIQMRRNVGRTAKHIHRRQVQKSRSISDK